MASSKLELLRSACESVENSEKVLAIAYQNRKKFLSKSSKSAQVKTEKAGEADKDQEGTKANLSDAIVTQSKAVWWDMLIKDLTETMHKKSKEIVNIYEDRDESFKTENAIISGTLAQSSGPQDKKEGEISVWDNFYDKLAEIDVSVF